MRRSLLTLFAFMLLSAWAGAQGTAPLSAATQVKQFKNNRLLIENLVDHGIDLANADNSVSRAEACRQTAQTLANYVSRAADEQDPDRVAELATLFGEVIRDGLVPNLDETRKTVTPESPAGRKAKTITSQTVSTMSDVRRALETPGKVGDHDRVKSARSALDALKAKLPQP